MKIEVRELVPVDPPKEYILTLSKEEATWLALVTRSIGGPPTGLRGHADHFSNKLRGVGIDSRSESYMDMAAQIDKGALYFKGAK